METTSVLKEMLNKLGEKKVKPYPVKLAKHAPALLKNSLKLRVVDCGDDEATMAELYALEWPAYSVESYGIWFTASPKHADGVVIVGALAHNMLEATKNAVELTPNPKVIIALGDKAIAWDKRFAGVAWGAHDFFNVDLDIPGNPPKAIDILSYLVSFVQGK